MLSNRQSEILHYYLSNADKFVPSKKIANSLNISIRTVKKELDIIKKACLNYHSFEFSSLPGKGTILKITNKNEFKNDIIAIDNIKSNQEENSDSQINSIISFLLYRNQPVTKYEIMSNFFISETTLYNRINKIKKILAKFDLSLEYITNIGYKVIGSEIHKRTCIVKLGISWTTNDINPKSEAKIYNTVADAFVKYKYHINEKNLQNITGHVFQTLQRINNHNYVEKISNENFDQKLEFKISKEILSKLIDKNSIEKKYFLNEVNLLTLIILGKVNYSNDENLKKIINTFIDDSFKCIEKKFSINFDLVENLKLLLVLHLVPLFYRIKSGTQLINPMRVKIHNSFPQAYDIALYFALLIEKKFHLTVSNNEISYLALYFNYGIEICLASSKGKKVLIITSLRKSETILLKHEILSSFPKRIESIDFISSSEIQKADNINITKKYDAVFTTDRYITRIKSYITFINIFPTENDIKKISLAINGYTEVTDFTNKFSNNCFFSGDLKTKKAVLNTIISNATKSYNLKENLLHSVNEREKLSSTYFENGIAIPHPLTPTSDTTFVSVALLKNSILWDEKIMLK